MRIGVVGQLVSENTHRGSCTGTKRKNVTRRWIPKSNGKLRPLGLPALEDKIVSKAVSLLLEQIYEQDFGSFSYGFRPGRSCHQALHDLRQGLLKKRIQFVIDCDISSFFGNLRHDVLLDLLRKRGEGRAVADPWRSPETSCHSGQARMGAERKHDHPFDARLPNFTRPTSVPSPRSGVLLIHADVVDPVLLRQHRVVDPPPQLPLCNEFR